jgi:hypothetical protein
MPTSERPSKLESLGRRRQRVGALRAFVLTLFCVRIGSSSGRRTASSTEGDDWSGLQEVISHAASKKAVTGSCHRFVGGQPGDGSRHGVPKWQGSDQDKPLMQQRCRQPSVRKCHYGHRPREEASCWRRRALGWTRRRRSRRPPETQYPLGPSVRRRRAVSQPLVGQIWWPGDADREGRTSWMDALCPLPKSRHGWYGGRRSPPQWKQVYQPPYGAPVTSPPELGLEAPSR